MLKTPDFYHNSKQISDPTAHIFLYTRSCKLISYSRSHYNMIHTNCYISYIIQKGSVLQKIIISGGITQKFNIAHIKAHYWIEA